MKSNDSMFEALNGQALRPYNKTNTHLLIFVTCQEVLSVGLMKIKLRLLCNIV